MSKERSKIYETQFVVALKRHFPEVVSQWRTSKDATDAFARDGVLYAPRPDIGVGPFSVTTGNRYEEIVKCFERCTPPRLKEALLQLPQRNRNPRCLLSIEIVCSGSTKHILGDITNASMMGLYGLVVIECGSEASGKALRVLNFLRRIKDTKFPTGTAAVPLFENVLVTDVVRLSQMLA